MAARPQAEPPAPIVLREPNVQPEGIEVAGDRAWRDWRLRKRRPDLRQRHTDIFPNINHLLDQRAELLIASQAKAAVQNDTPFRRRAVKDLHGKGYIVEQLQFRPLQSTQDKVDLQWATQRLRKPQAQDELDRLPDFFFEELSSSLFARVWDFAADTFGQDQQRDAYDDVINSYDWTGNYLQHLPEDFIRCASQTARADQSRRSGNDLRGYEYLFVDRESRISLCTSVVAKLLQENCLDSLLFGARKIEREALRKTDEAQEDTADGFARKMSRTASVPKYLINDLLTQNFWPEVDRVTLGILELLMPMINFAGELHPYLPWPALTEVHQSLHNIVAEAGWLANGLALTRSCFWIEFPRPGQLWDLRQEHVSDVIWTRSREATRAQDAINAGPRIRRTAKVQISLWPFFERSYPYKQDLVSGDINSGESTTVVHKAQVVYYSGDDNDAGEQLEDYTLRQWIDDYKERNAWLWGPNAWYTWPFIATMLLAALYFTWPYALAKYDDVRHRGLGLPRLSPANWAVPDWRQVLCGPNGTRFDASAPPPLAAIIDELPEDAPVFVTVAYTLTTGETTGSRTLDHLGPLGPLRPSPIWDQSSESALRAVTVPYTSTSTQARTSTTTLVLIDVETTVDVLDSLSKTFPRESLLKESEQPSDQGKSTTILHPARTENTSSYQPEDQSPSERASSVTIALPETIDFPNTVEYPGTIDLPSTVNRLNAVDLPVSTAQLAEPVATAEPTSTDDAGTTDSPPTRKLDAQPPSYQEDSIATSASVPTTESVTMIVSVITAEPDAEDDLGAKEAPVTTRKTHTPRLEFLESKKRSMSSKSASHASKSAEKEAAKVKEAAEQEAAKLKKAAEMEAAKVEKAAESETAKLKKSAESEAAKVEVAVAKVEKDVAQVETDAVKVEKDAAQVQEDAAQRKKDAAEVKVVKAQSGDNRGFFGSLFDWPWATGNPLVKTVPVNAESSTEKEQRLVHSEDDGIEMVEEVVFRADPGSNYNEVQAEELADILSTFSEGARASKPIITKERLENPERAFTATVEPDATFTDPAQPGVILDMNTGFWVRDSLLGHEYSCWIKTRTAVCVSVKTETVQATAAPTVKKNAWEETASATG